MTTRKSIYSLSRTIAGLRYIAKSPKQEHGGFHHETIMIAKSALWFLQHPTRKEIVDSFKDIMDKSSDYCAAKESERMLSNLNYWKRNLDA